LNTINIWIRAVENDGDETCRWIVKPFAVDDDGALDMHVKDPPAPINFEK
jgi:hypothetical protein